MTRGDGRDGARSDDPARKLSEALRARATGSPSPFAGPSFGPPSFGPPSFGTPPPPAPPPPARTQVSTGTALLLTLLGGLVLGALLALLSLWAPGVLPVLG